MSQILIGIIICTIIIIYLWIYSYEPFNVHKNEDCESKTMTDCLSSSQCRWCINNEYSKCIPQSYTKALNKCDHIYSGDIVSRIKLSNDSDYKNYEEKPLFE